jgi:O-acetyl-ADP-ribose deacetylase (regulator of RNase III)
MSTADLAIGATLWACYRIRCRVCGMPVYAMRILGLPRRAAPTTACTRQGAEVRSLRDRSLRRALQVKPGVGRAEPPMSEIEVLNVDITTLPVDAIVNAANCGLSGGGGVDGAIHRAAGPELIAACREVGPCPTGSARITPGFRLPARYVIHAVGPVWEGGDRGEAGLLASAYRASMKLATENGFKSLAFPAISCGAYRFPIQQAAEIAVHTVRQELMASALNRVVFTVRDAVVERAFRRSVEARS